METSSRGKGTPASRAGIVGKMRRVSIMACDGMMPAGIAAAGGQDQHALQFAELHNFVARLICQWAIGNLRTSKEAARSSPKQRLHKRKLEQVLQCLLLVRFVHVHGISSIQ